MPATCCSTGCRRIPPTHSTGRGAQIPTAEPTVEIGPLTIPMEVVPNGFDTSPILQMTATEVRVAALRKSKRPSKLRTLLSTPGNAEEPTDSSVTSSEPSPPEDYSTTEQRAPEGILYVMNVLTGVVHVAGTPAGADSSRSLDYDGKPPLPAQFAIDMLHFSAATATLTCSLPDQSMSSRDPDGVFCESRQF